MSNNDIRRSLADAAPRPFWLDRPDAPAPTEPLTAAITTDLAVIGGGFSGLWTALLAKERDPGREVVLLEARTVGWAASGRNGGFCSASLTHGLENGASRFPDELALLQAMGRENLDQIEEAVHRYGIDCDFARTGELTVATRPWHLDGMAEFARRSEAFGGRFTLFDEAGVRAQVNSPTYLGGVWDHDGCAMLDPARLAWGLRDACRRAGVRVHELTAVDRIAPVEGGLVLHTRHGKVRARRVALATGAHGRLLLRLQQFVVPVYDYALMTEPLTDAQVRSLGWANRQGIGDGGNQFHYYRISADNRILFGGYDAVYFAGGRITPRHDQHWPTFTTLAQHFFATFPQLEGVRFTHRWGGVIDTCSRFSAFFGQAYQGRLAYALGYTGLGVGATRFGAQVMLDLLAGQETARTRLEMVRRKPVPFPPEPLRTGVIGLTRWSIARADEDEGRRNLWLRNLDRLGLGFDS